MNTVQLKQKKKLPILLLVPLLALASFFTNTSHAQNIDQIEQEIKQYEATLGKLRDEQSSLQNEIKQFELEIKKIEKEIQRSKQQLIEVEADLESTETQIIETKNTITIKEETLKEYLQLLDHADDITIIEAVFSANSLSTLVDNLQYSETLQDKTQKTLAEFKDIKQTLEKQKEVFTETKQETEILLSLLSNQENDLALKKQSKEILLEETQGEEEKYLALFDDAKDRKESALIALIATSNTNTSSGAISIEEAKQYAKAASTKTGVRAEVIMAVIEQETFFGSNVGTGRYTTDMRPSFHTKFEQICAGLGIDPNTTPVSKKPENYQGWGGAMGYAQIMPPEWLSIRSEIASATGNPSPSPWNPADAFMGAAILLKNKGAANPDTEFEGVGRYFAGAYWKKYSWYASSVLKKAEKYK